MLTVCHSKTTRSNVFKFYEFFGYFYPKVFAILQKILLVILKILIREVFATFATFFTALDSFLNIQN